MLFAPCDYARHRLLQLTQQSLALFFAELQRGITAEEELPGVPEEVDLAQRRTGGIQPVSADLVVEVGTLDIAEADIDIPVETLHAFGAKNQRQGDGDPQRGADSAGPGFVAPLPECALYGLCQQRMAAFQTLTSTTVPSDLMVNRARTLPG